MYRGSWNQQLEKTKSWKVFNPVLSNQKNPTLARTFQLHFFQFHYELSNLSFFQLSFPTTCIPYVHY